MTYPILDHPLAVDAALRQRLVGLARHWLGDASAAEDLLHDAYLRTAMDGALPATAAGREAWLVTVLRNLCIDQLRRQGRYQAVLAQLPDAWAAQDRDEPEHLAAQAQRIDAALLTLVHALPADDVAALLLYEVFDFSHAELGALAGRSEVASRQRLHRMMSRLDRARPEAFPEDEDTAALFALCRYALATCETAALVTLVRTASPQSMAAITPIAQSASATSFVAPACQMIQVGDHLALRIQAGDGPVTCIPMGEAITETA